MKQGTLRRGGLIGAALLLTACGSGGGGGSSDPQPPVVNPPPASASRACYGNDQPACNLRTYQVMVESFVDGDGSANSCTGP